MKSSEHDVQNTCSKDPIGVPNCLLNLNCMVINFQVKLYNCFPVWTNYNCRYTLCQHQYSIQSCNVSWQSLKQWSNYLSICASDTFMCDWQQKWATAELRVRLAQWNWFKASSNFFLLTIPRRYFFCGSFVLFMSCICHAFASVHRVCSWSPAGQGLGIKTTTGIQV